MTYLDEGPLVGVKNPMSCRWPLCVGLMWAAAVALAGCGGKDEKAGKAVEKAGQALVRVNGKDITVIQLNDELRRANVQPGQHEAESKQLLESLIDRQVLVDEAMRNKVDRTPNVMLAIERAKAQIIAQAYLRSKTGKIGKPFRVEIDDYFQKHPEFFSKRKEFDMRTLVIASKDLSDELKLVVNSARSLGEVSAWLDKHDVQYAHNQISRSTADIPPELAAKLRATPKGRIFIISEGENSMLVSLDNVKDSPVNAKEAAPQIERYLTSKKIKEVADTEITHLRSLAKIEYINRSAPIAVAGDEPAGELTKPETKPVGAAAAVF